MRKTIILLTAVSFGFSSCQKIYDHILNHDKPVPCKVLNIHSEAADASDNADILYNNAGYPTQVNYVYKNSPESLIYDTVRYTYDSKKRLRSEKSTYFYVRNGWDYAYIGNSEWPVRDTTPGVVGDIYVEDFEYDQWNRMIKITKRIIVYPGGIDWEYPDHVLKYYYDINGNRQEDPSNPNYPGIIHYTNKPSLVSLHPVWRIVHRDFSVNSVDYAKTYNSKGLPTEIKPIVPYLQPFLIVHGGSKLTYQCKK